MDKRKKPAGKVRTFYGISRPEKGFIEYKAAVAELYPGEAAPVNCDMMLIPQEKYISITIEDYMNRVPEIGNSFQELILQPGLDPQGYCIEWYFHEKDVNCMIRLE